ncbi:MAG TPA: MarC family protein [Polyangiaceae bacterium]|jgi:multiple antibiotic resistance protein|nr:MarC family protein [Polyangiaceae bacterium]
MFRLIESATLLLVLLNPFALSVYLIELIHKLDPGTLLRVVLRAGLISGAVFAVFALTGVGFFERVLQVRFASFQIFGGLLFLVIALRFVVSGGRAMHALRGENPEHLAGAVAMPFMIGPGTVGASVIIGRRSGAMSLLAIALALLATVLFLLASKWTYDRLRDRNARLVARYVDIVGRVTALVIGTIAVQMILNGWSAWHASSQIGVRQ